MQRINRLPALRAGLLGLGCSFTLGALASAQDTDRVKTLEERLDALQAELKAEREAFELELEVLGEELSGLQGPGQAPQPASAFNPEITIFGNSLVRADNRRVFADDDPMEGRVDDRFHFRELEIDFRAAIDPFADGVVITSFESEVPGEYEAGIEEAYVDLKRLPFVHTAPLGLKLRAGRFRPEFGRFNQIHLHDLPQPSYPRALGAFLGPEGYVQEGVSARFFLPAGGEANAVEANLQLLTGGGLPLAEEQSGSQLAALGRVKYFRELGGANTLELGSSLWRSDSDHELFGLDASYKWRPHLRGQSKSFLLGGELFRARVDEDNTSNTPLGYYVWSQYQFSRSFYLGVRYDSSQALQLDRAQTNTVGVFGTYYTSEFLRMRLGYEHATSDDPLLNGRDSLLFELNFIFGSHPTEPYWVSR